MKETMHQFSIYCVGCKQLIEPNEEIGVVQIKVGSIRYGIFNAAYNYPTQYIHEGCYEAYLEKKVELRREYASNSDKGNPA